MKRWTALAGFLALAISLAAPVLATGYEDDLTVIKRAVRGGPSCEPEKSVKWLRLLVTDNGSRRDVLKINLPIIVTKNFPNGAKDTHRHCGKAEAKSALRNLLRMGSLTLLEIADDDSKIKIWLE